MDKLARIKGAWPYIFAVFLNAFVDLGHKIIIQNTIWYVNEHLVRLKLIQKKTIDNSDVDLSAKTQSEYLI